MTAPHVQDWSTDALDACVNACAENLQQHVAQQDDARCLLLTGPALLGAYSADTIAEYSAQGVGTRSVNIPHPHLDGSYRPYLLELHLDRSRHADIARQAIAMALTDWQPEALQQAQGHRIAGFLDSSASLTEVARHLASVLLQHGPDGRRRLVSLLDPAAFEGVWRVCEPHQQTILCGPITAWRSVNRWFDWSVYQPESPDTGSAGHALGLTAAQWQALGDVRAINRAWAKAAAHRIGVTSDTFDQLPTTLQRARQYGVTDTADQETFAWHALVVRPEFDRHPTIQRCLRTRARDDTYSLAVADLSDADWRAIQRNEPIDDETRAHA